MRRREFVGYLGSIAGLWPLASSAQQKLATIGMLATSQVDDRANSRIAFQQGLLEVGYIEGQNLAIERRGAGGRYDTLPGLLAELTQQPLNALVCGGVPATLAAFVT